MFTLMGPVSVSRGAWARIRRGFRVVRGALIFSSFYLGAALWGVAVLPLLWCLGGTRAERWRRCQRSVTAGFITVLDAMRWAGILDFDPRDVPPPEKGAPAVVVANHPSTVDVVAVLSVFREACVLVKPSNWSHPLLRPLFRWCGHVRSTDGSVGDTRRLMAEIRARLDAGFDVVIFPEGTRSPPGQLGMFHKAAFSIAIHAGCELLPLIIEADPPILHRHAPWYTFPDEPAGYRIAPQPRMRGAGTTTRKLQREVSRLYQQALQGHVGPCGPGLTPPIVYTGASHDSQ